jgi:RNA polymerase sigma factor (sigma-70 family)
LSTLLAAQPGPSDESLARELAAGRTAAFDELYRRYSGQLAAYGGRLVNDRSAGEDIAQVTLMNAYQAVRRGSEPVHVRPWLYRIARNVALETIERRREVLPLRDDHAWVHDPREHREARAELVNALRTLPYRQRNAFLLREVQGLRVSEIAARLGLSSAQVEQALFAARNRLAEHLAFGGRLSCASVRKLDTARLTHAQQRGVNSHVRSCHACKSGRRRGVLALVPSGLVEALRNAAAALLGGGAGAPVAAKVAAVAVTAAAVGAAPVVHRDADAVAAPVRASLGAPAVATASASELTRGPSGVARRPVKTAAAAAAPASAASAKARVHEHVRGALALPLPAVEAGLPAALPPIESSLPAPVDAGPAEQIPTLESAPVTDPELEQPEANPNPGEPVPVPLPEPDPVKPENPGEEYQPGPNDPIPPEDKDPTPLPQPEPDPQPTPDPQPSPDPEPGPGAEDGLTRSLSPQP